MRNCLVVASALALAFPQTALAGDSEDFAGCDGMKKPRRDADGMRGVADLAEYGHVSNNRRNQPQSVIRYCTSVLEGDRIRDHQTLRRAHVLRARAAAYVQTGEVELALVDIATAREQVSDRAEDQIFQRSIGVSLDLLEALALADNGDAERAAALALNAREQRPYALQVQGVANRILEITAPDRSDPANLMQISPSLRQQAIPRLIANGDFIGAVQLAEREELLDVPETLANFNLPLGLSRNFEQVLTAQLGAILLRVDVAYALAATGDTERAQVLLARLLELQAPSDNPSAGSQLLGRLLSEDVFANRLRLADARLALAEGRVEDAVAIEADLRIPESALGSEFRAALVDAGVGNTVPEAESAALQLVSAGAAEVASNEQSAELAETMASAPDVKPEPTKPTAETQALDTSALRPLAYALLFPPETARSVIDYERSRPNILGAIIGGALSMGTSLLGGIDRTNGFRSTENDNGNLTVEFTGGTLSGPMVQEMTLLRAAELAHEAQMPFFEIVRRQDYMQYRVGTQYGMEISRLPTGFKTELEVRFLQTEDESPFAVETLHVIDTLGPLYYEGE